MSGALQRQGSAEVKNDGGKADDGRHSSSTGKAECAASLALTMLLMLKRFLKVTYGMSDERIAAFSPDLPEKRKQVCCQLLCTFTDMLSGYAHVTITEHANTEVSVPAARG